MRNKPLLMVMVAIGLMAALWASACGPTSGAPSSPPEADGESSPTSLEPPAISLPPTTPVGTGPQEPERSTDFEPAECAFELPPFRDVECGYVTMPAHRDGTGDGEVRLHVAIVRAETDTRAPDPLVYLAGGPGENALSLLVFLIDLFHPFTQDRDLIFFDQRGTGFSEPALDCPELVELAYETLEVRLPDEEALALELDAIQACRERLTGMDIDLAEFSTAENAADVRDLRVALGYEEWNLLGVSYGTRLALTVMRDHPEGIRSVILDSTYPLEANLYEALPANTDRVFSLLAASCQSDPECAAAYPDLLAQIDAAFWRLEEQPVRSTVIHPLTLETFDAVIDGERFISQLFQGLYSTNVIPVLPEMIANAAEGDVDLVSVLAGISLLNREMVSAGMQLSVQCREDIGTTTDGRLQEALEAAPNVRAYFENGIRYGTGMIEGCRVWDVPTAPAPVAEPFVTDIPVLVLAGEFDPVTPPEWGRTAAEELSQTRFVEFPGYGHGAITGACGGLVAAAFVNNPSAELDLTCVEELGAPVYALPLEQTTMVPFSDPDTNVSGVRPERWQEAEPGVFMRTPLGETVLVQLALPGVPVDLYLSLLMNELGLAEPPEPVGERTVNGVTWTMYEAHVGDAVALLALAEDQETTLSVIAAGLPAAGDALREHVFLPAVEGFRLE